MAVIIELSVPSSEFEFGRILTMEDDTVISLETMIPMGEGPIPFFRVYKSVRDSFEAQVREHPAVNEIYEVSSHNDETLYALDWEVTDDTFLETVRDVGGNLLEATGSPDAWGFEIRFPDHDAVSTFQERCFDADIPIDIKRIFNPTKPDAGPWYGLTAPQRQMLIRAVEAGYYSLPRETSTQALADDFDISDQAVTERLRRAIQTLVTNTLLLTADAE